MEKLHYGRSLLATVLGGILASVIMILPAWFWAAVVVDVPFGTFVGRQHGLDTSDRFLLYGGGLVFTFIGYLVYAWCVKALYKRLQGVEPEYWDTFAALLALGILAALVGYAFPFLAVLIAIFVAPIFVNGSMGPDTIRGGAPRDSYDPDRVERLAPTSELR